MKKKLPIIFIILCIILAITIVILVYELYKFNVIPQKVYTAKDFNISTIKSSIDYNNNGIDDYKDILLGARSDAENHPTYNSKYFGNGGYPPNNIGVCTDVVWRAFKNAGYCLRDMGDNDIKNNLEEYIYVETRDKNIDFRRVGNLDIFFKKYAQSLTLDINKIEEWQPGDIVVFGNEEHIGIASDKRNSKGQTYIIHNGGQPNREEDFFKYNNMEVIGHYRFDASKINENVLVKWYE